MLENSRQDHQSDSSIGNDEHRRSRTTILTEQELMSVLLGFMITSLCSHMAAVHLFTDTARNECPYLGYKCSNFDDFDAGKCTLQCDSRDRQCNRMGYWASASTGKGDLYLKTQGADAFPYCSKNERSSLSLMLKWSFSQPLSNRLQSGSDFLQTRGTVTLTLIGTLRTITVTFDK